MGIRQFLIELENGFVKKWSTTRNPIVIVIEKDAEGNEIRKETHNLNLKQYNTEPEHDLSDLTSACPWNKIR